MCRTAIPWCALRVLNLIGFARASAKFSNREGHDRLCGTQRRCRIDVCLSLPILGIGRVDGDRRGHILETPVDAAIEGADGELGRFGLALGADRT
jgi:hypothetical protein